MNRTIPVTQKSVRFRARSFVAFVLTPETPLATWLTELDRWTHNSPGFFVGRPVVLDLTALKPSTEDAKALVAALAERGIRTMAVEGPEADIADLPPVLRGARPAVIEEKAAQPSRNPARESAPEPAPAPPEPQSLILDSPIRSGQSIIHPYGDVIVLGSVGSGSEVIAAGSIHVYGTLRGRALAGAMGNSRARIFTRRNEAELIAVNGCYRTAEDMEPGSRGKPAQVFLDSGVLWIAALD